MRPVQLADIETAIRVLLPLEKDRREDVIAEIIVQARIADKYRKHLKRMHPEYGTGSIMSAARPYFKASRPPYCDADYLSCVRVILDALARFGSNHVT